MASIFKSINIKLSAALLLTTISAVQFYWLWQVKEFSPGTSALDAFGSYGLLYAIFLFIKYGPNYYLSTVSGYFIIGVQSFLIAIGWVYSCELSFLYSIFNEHNYAVFWYDTKYIRILLGWVLLCDFSIINYLVERIQKEQQGLDQAQATEQLRKEAELFKLRQQLHPHFLFNSLNSINALIGKEPTHARQMVQQLSEFLRHTLKKEDNDLITIKEELDDLRIYLSIEQVRFGHRLTIDEYIHADCLDAKIPPFLLQPLVENAIKYGLYGTTGPVSIYIKGRISNGQFLFSIINPFDPEGVTPRGTGFGLESVKRRLYLLFARNDLLKVSSEQVTVAGEAESNHYFTAAINIPIVTDTEATK